MALTTVQVHGEILNPDGLTPAVGTVTFRTLIKLRDIVDNITYTPADFVATLDLLGEFTIVIPATDNPDLIPASWVYQVYISTATWTQTIYVQIPFQVGTVEFADLTPLAYDPCNPTDLDPPAPFDLSLFVLRSGDTMTGDLTVNTDVFVGDDLTVGDDLSVLGDAGVTGLLTANTISVANISGLGINFTNGTITNDLAVGDDVTVGGDLAVTGTFTAPNVVYLDPPLVAGNYVGNTIVPPPGSPNTVGWMQSTPIPHSAGDTNPDFLRINALDEFGNTVATTTWNGNGEGRNRPSRRTRVAHRVFESAEAVGYSTDQFAQWSTNPTNPALREPLLAPYGSAHPTKPGWIEATRIINALLGQRVEGNYNPGSLLNPMNFRGRRSSAGPPLALPWIVGDWIVDSLGFVYYCSVAGTPGTWVGSGPGTPVAVGFTAPAGNAATISDGASSGAPYALTTTLFAGDNRVYLDGAVSNGGGAPIAGGTVLFTITAAHRPAAWVQFNERTSTTLSARVTIRPDGTVRLDQALAVGATCSFDGLNYRLV